MLCMMDCLQITKSTEGSFQRIDRAYPNFDKFTQNSAEFTKRLQFIKTWLTVNRYSFTCGTNEKT